jgi:peroxiredoxin
MSKRLEQFMIAPDFTLKDTQGKRVCLSDFRSRQPVVLVITRGFM